MYVDWWRKKAQQEELNMRMMTPHRMQVLEELASLTAQQEFVLKFDGKMYVLLVGEPEPAEEEGCRESGGATTAETVRVC